MKTYTVYCAVRDGRSSEMVTPRSTHETHAEALAEVARLNADRLRGMRFFTDPMADIENGAQPDTAAELANIRALLAS